MKISSFFHNLVDQLKPGRAGKPPAERPQASPRLSGRLLRRRVRDVFLPSRTARTVDNDQQQLIQLRSTSQSRELGEQIQRAGHSLATAVLAEDPGAVNRAVTGFADALAQWSQSCEGDGQALRALMESNIKVVCKDLSRTQRRKLLQAIDKGLLPHIMASSRLQSRLMPANDAARCYSLALDMLSGVTRQQLSRSGNQAFARRVELLTENMLAKDRASLDQHSFQQLLSSSQMLNKQTVTELTGLLEQPPSTLSCPEDCLPQPGLTAEQQFERSVRQLLDAIGSNDQQRLLTASLCLQRDLMPYANALRPGGEALGVDDMTGVLVTMLKQIQPSLSAEQLNRLRGAITDSDQALPRQLAALLLVGGDVAGSLPPLSAQTVVATPALISALVENICPEQKQSFDTAVDQVFGGAADDEAQAAPGYLQPLTPKELCRTMAALHTRVGSN